MAIVSKFNPQPAPTADWINGDGTPAQVFYQYMKVVDTLLRALNNNQIGPLTSAASDKAAALAGVPVGGLYATPAGVVHVRLS